MLCFIFHVLVCVQSEELLKNNLMEASNTFTFSGQDILKFTVRGGEGRAAG